MKYEVKLKDSAELDVLDIYNWYESEQIGLGRKLMDEIENNIQILASNPLLFQKIYRDVRRAILHKFPYGVYYLVEENVINIISISHLSRHPRNWKKRLTKN